MLNCSDREKNMIGAIDLFNDCWYIADFTSATSVWTVNNEPTFLCCIKIFWLQIDCILFSNCDNKVIKYINEPERLRVWGDKSFWRPQFEDFYSIYYYLVNSFSYFLFVKCVNVFILFVKCVNVFMSIKKTFTHT